MSTIERLAELAKRATQGDWKALNMVYENGEPMTPEQLGNYVRNAVLANPDNKDYLFISCTKADGDYDLCHIGNGPDGPYNAALIAACNPAAITQAHAEHAELEREYGLLKISNEWNERIFKQADQCAHEREAELLAKNRTIAEIERRNAELVEAARLAESALSFIYGGEPVDPTGAITALRAALAHTSQTQEKADEAE